MDAELRDRIERVRAALEADPDGILVGWVNPAAGAADRTDLFTVTYERAGP